MSDRNLPSRIETPWCRRSRLAFFLVAMLLLSLQVTGSEHQWEWTVDTGSELTVEDVIVRSGDMEWQSLAEGEALNLGFNRHPVWLRLGVEPAGIDRVLEVGQPLLDQVSLYWVREDAVIRSWHTGDVLPFDSRPVYHRNFVFPVPPADTRIVGYLRLQTEGSLQAPLSIEPLADHVADDQVTLGLQMVFVGTMLALALYNALLLFLVRDIAYLWYVLTVLNIALVQMTFQGISFQWLWPQWPVLNGAVASVVATNVLFGALFTDAFLNPRRYSPVAGWIPRVVAVLAVLAFAYSLAASYQDSVRIVAGLTVMAAPAVWLLAFYLWQRGQALAKFYLLAWTPLLAGHVILALSKIGILPQATWVDLAPQVGAVFEVILLSFALAYRINLERRWRLQAQEDALRAQREANQTLEARVAERTRELEQANEKLTAMSRTDGLTGIANRRRLDDRLEAEWRRCLRQGVPLSLLLMDIDHFKAINDEFGHLAGDACLKHLALLCQQGVSRGGDLVARYGGEEFAILLPETLEAGACDLAERLRKTIAATPARVPDHDQPIPLTVSIGVTCMTPTEEGDGTRLVVEADEALYAAKHQGRNRVMVWRQDAEPEQTGPAPGQPVSS